MLNVICCFSILFFLFLFTISMVGNANSCLPAAKASVCVCLCLWTCMCVPVCVLCHFYLQWASCISSNCFDLQHATFTPRSESFSNYTHTHTHTSLWWNAILTYSACVNRRHVGSNISCLPSAASASTSASAPSSSPLSLSSLSYLRALSVCFH